MSKNSKRKHRHRDAEDRSADFKSPHHKRHQHRQRDRQENLEHSVPVTSITVDNHPLAGCVPPSQYQKYNIPPDKHKHYGEPLPLPPFPAEWNVPLVITPPTVKSVIHRVSTERALKQHLSDQSKELVTEFKSGQPNPVRLLPSKLSHLFIEEVPIDQPAATGWLRKSSDVFREKAVYQPEHPQLFKLPDPKKLSVEAYLLRGNNNNSSVASGSATGIDYRIGIHNERAIAEQNFVIQIDHELAGDDVLTLQEDIDLELERSHTDSEDVQEDARTTNGWSLIH